MILKIAILGLFDIWWASLWQVYNVLPTVVKIYAYSKRFATPELDLSYTEKPPNQGQSDTKVEQVVKQVWLKSASQGRATF